MTHDSSRSRCQALADLIPLVASGDASVEECLQVEEHTAACPACRGDLDADRRLCETARRELAPVPPPSGAQARAAHSAASAFRWLPRLAAAAALLLAGLAVGRWTAPEPAALVGVPATRPGKAEPPAERVAGLARGRPGALSVFSPAARPYLTAAARREAPPGSGD